MAEVTVTPGESIQTKVDANPVGTTFRIKAGIHRRQSVIPKNGDVFVGEPGAVLDGEDVTPHAFCGMPGSIKDVLISDLEVMRYQVGVKTGGGGEPWNWEMARVNVHDCAQMGVHGDNAAGWWVHHSRIHHNGAIGLVMSGDGITVEDCEIDSNNTGGNDPYVEAGGTKFVYTDELRLLRNHVHGNKGPGLWCDINNINTVYDGNRCLDNDGPGIFHEVSYDAVIRNNVVERCGHQFEGWIDGAGILVSCSPNVDIYGNTIVDCRCGIAGKQVFRDDAATATHGPWELRDLLVHDNNIIRSGRSGLARNTNDPVMLDAGNRFYSNTYCAETGFWGPDGEMTKGQWLAAGQDAGSRFVTVWPIPEPPTVPAAPLWLPTAAVMLSWPAVTGATSYKIKYQKDGATTSRTLNGTATSRKIGSLTAGLWRFWLAPVVGGIQQPWSAPAEIRMG